MLTVTFVSFFQGSYDKYEAYTVVNSAGVSGRESTFLSQPIEFKI
jgi:hypothetical protein